MTSIVVAVISAGTAIVVLILGDLLFGSKILKMLERHNESGCSSHQTLISDHNRQEQDHNKLLDDTNTLKIDSKIILKISEKIDGKIETIDRNLFTEKENKRLQIESLTDKQREMKNSIDRLVGFADEFEKISLENSKLWRENEDLNEENKELRRIIKLQKARILELEEIDELEM